MAKAELPAPERTSHPFFMFDMIRGIPKGFRATLDVMHSRGGLASAKERIAFTGNGTAYYASLMGSQVLRSTGIAWHAPQAFELANYPSDVVKDSMVVGVSHSGITKSTIDALLSARQRGSEVIGVTHFRGRPISDAVDETILVGDSPDLSRCHTKTFVDSAAACLLIAIDFADKLAPGRFRDIRRELDTRLADELDEVVGRPEGPVEAARALKGVSKVFIAGGGPNAVTAREAALKVKESSFIPAEGIDLEEVLHGPWVAFDKETLVVVIAPRGPSEQRASDIIEASRRIGAKTVVVTDGSLGADYTFRVPKTIECLSPFLTIVPLYYLAYFIAVGRGNNPDFLRYLDPIYWDARQVIFPPGTH